MGMGYGYPFWQSQSWLMRGLRLRADGSPYWTDTGYNTSDEVTPLNSTCCLVRKLESVHNENHYDNFLRKCHVTLWFMHFWRKQALAVVEKGAKSQNNFTGKGKPQSDFSPDTPSIRSTHSVLYKGQFIRDILYCPYGKLWENIRVISWYPL